MSWAALAAARCPGTVPCLHAAAATPPSDSARGTLRCHLTALRCSRQVEGAHSAPRLRAAGPRCATLVLDTQRMAGGATARAGCGLQGDPRASTARLESRCAAACSRHRRGRECGQQHRQRLALGTLRSAARCGCCWGLRAWPCSRACVVRACRKRSSPLVHAYAHAVRE